MRQAKSRRDHARRAVQAADLIGRYFAEGDGDRPSVVEQLWNLFNDESVDDHGRLLVSVADKIKIGKLFAAESHQHALAAEALGFLGKPAPVQKAQTILNVQLLNGLTFDERMKAIEAEVNGRPLAVCEIEAVNQEEGSLTKGAAEAWMD